MTFWTEPNIAKLTKLWDDGISAGQIARRMNVGRGAICAKADRLGLTPRRMQTYRAGRAGSPAQEYDERAEYDPNRADKLLRRFSWEDQASPRASGAST